MIKYFALFFFLLLLCGCASDRQLSDDICFSHKSTSYEINLKVAKDGSFSMTEIAHSDGIRPGSYVDSKGDWEFIESNKIILAFRNKLLLDWYYDFPNSKDFQKIDSVTLRLNTLADSLQLADGIWLYRTTCELKGVKMRRGMIDSAGVFRRDK
jgi:hypothetical protein